MVVGASAPTLHDVHLTSTTDDELMAGPEVQANAIWTALRGLPLRSGPGGFNLLAIVLLADGGAPGCDPRFHPTGAALAAIPIGLAYAVAMHAVFASGTVLALVVPLVDPRRSPRC